MYERYVYGKDGRKYVCIGYLVEVEDKESCADIKTADVVTCPVCGCIVSGAVHGNKKT